MSRPDYQVFVCAQNRPPTHPRGSCAAKGSVEVLQAFWAEVQKRGAFEKVLVTNSGCLGPCAEGANVLVYPEGILYRGVTVADVGEIVDSHLMGGVPVARLAASGAVW